MPLRNNDIQGLFISTFSGLSYGVPIAVVSGILGEPKFLELSATTRAFVSSSLVFGITFGAILAVILTEHIGRRLIIIISGFESFIFAALLSAMFQASAIIGMRLLQGVGIGAICTIACIYVMELASDKYKGTFVFLFQDGDMNLPLLVFQYQLWVLEEYSAKKVQHGNRRKK
ncbi:MAG: hypothetical protein EZS28_011173 [Streblomastix strix]|uniref:Major facilitator superfamily (MFS) profile domain-containing protein n=1 Tax=Streblomastix strix TaxID=222440 RepID=A0A5J4WEW9_9EUKA|nr:MAG: hypothetical protein EZS28_011173 [Streblomastix strix]